MRPRPGERTHPFDVSVSFFGLLGSGGVEIPGESICGLQPSILDLAIFESRWAAPSLAAARQSLN